MKHPISNHIAAAMEIPEELSHAEPFLTVVGSHSITIENYKSICRFTGRQIILKTTHGLLFIEGNHLQIPQCLTGELKIIGEIEQISFQKSEKHQKS